MRCVQVHTLYRMEQHSGRSVRCIDRAVALWLVHGLATLGSHSAFYHCYRGLYGFIAAVDTILLEIGSKAVPLFAVAACQRFACSTWLDFGESNARHNLVTGKSRQLNVSPRHFVYSKYHGYA